MDNLRAWVRDGLPANVLGLWDKLEQFAGARIDVEEDDRPPRSPEPSTDPAVQVDFDKARIILRRFDKVDPGDILHELLHVERYWVERVPMLVPKVDQVNEERWNICSDIENTLEHLVIVPRETEYGYNPFFYRTDEARLKWKRYPWPTLHGFARTKEVLLSRLALNNVRDDQLITFAHKCLSRESIYAKADALNERVSQLIPTKPLQLSCVVRALGIPTEQVELLYLDVATREPRREALPLLA